MGDSGDAGSDGTESDSDGDGGSFEFGNVEEAVEEGAEEAEDELSDAVDFSLGMDDVDFGDDDDSSDEDAPDPPDAPDGEDTEPSTTTTEDSEGSAPATGSPAAAENQPTASGEEDPPDPSDSSDGESEEADGSFYDIDPVDNSQKAFDFAENQSKAAYEFAYEGATQNPLARFLAKYVSHTVRKRLDEVFSRKMLGSVLVGGAFSKIIEACVGVWLGSSGVWRIAAWVGVFLVATVVFVWWDHISQKATEAAEQATEAATEAAESASKKAEAATEAASQAADQAAETATGDGEANATPGASDPTKPTKLDGQTADAAGGRTRAPARRRAPDRRANKRFEPESTTQERLSTYENGDEFDRVELAELPQQGGGFENAGDSADEP